MERSPAGGWAGGLSVPQHDDGNATAIVIFGAKSGPPVAEEAVFLGHRVVRAALDCSDAAPLQPARDIAAYVEHGMPGPLRRYEEVGIGLVLGQEAIREFRTDLVRTLGDAWADACDDTLGPGAERHHGRHRGIDHAAFRTLPPGMGGADHLRSHI